jgi:hypothetical protein
MGTLGEYYGVCEVEKNLHPQPKELESPCLFYLYLYLEEEPEPIHRLIVYSITLRITNFCTSRGPPRHFDHDMGFV